LYVRYEYDQDVFANGVPLITAVVEGKKVYDPRTATTSYSNNAALCIRDFLTSSYGLSDSAIDDISFASAANECDENVTLAGSGTEKRYTLNGIVKADRSLGDVLGDMVTACAGTLFWGSGYWKLKAGAYSSPVKTLTLDDLRGPINLQTRISMQETSILFVVRLTMRSKIGLLLTIQK
jgi:predicted phage tail protein